MDQFYNFLNNNYLIIKSLHVISMVAWMAAMLYLPRLFVYHTEMSTCVKTSKIFKKMEKWLLKIIINVK